jgi:hypothetical protein
MSYKPIFARVYEELQAESERLRGQLDALKNTAAVPLFSREQVAPLVTALGWINDQYDDSIPQTELAHRMYDVRCESAKALDHARKLGIVEDGK